MTSTAVVLQKMFGHMHASGVDVVSLIDAVEEALAAHIADVVPTAALEGCTNGTQCTVLFGGEIATDLLRAILTPH